MVDIDTEHLPEGDEKVARRAVDVRRHRPPLRPGQPDHDVPDGRRLAAAHGPRPRASARGSVVLDLACGTGDLCRELAGRTASAVGFDLSYGMLAAARTDAPAGPGRRPRACPCPTARSTASRAASPCATWSSSTPFFAELARVVRPGGRIALLEVAEPPNPVLRWGHGIYFGKVVPLHRRAALRRRRLPLPAQVGGLPARARRDAAHARRGRLRGRRRARCCRPASPSSSPRTRRRSRVAGRSTLVARTRPARPRRRPARGRRRRRRRCSSSDAARARRAGRGRARIDPCPAGGGRPDAAGRRRRPRRRSRSTTRSGCPAAARSPRRAALRPGARRRRWWCPRVLVGRAEDGTRWVTTVVAPDAPRRRTRPPTCSTRLAGRRRVAARRRADPGRRAADDRTTSPDGRRRSGAPRWPRPRDELRAGDGRARSCWPARSSSRPTDRSRRAAVLDRLRRAYPSLHALRASTASSAPPPSCSWPASATSCGPTPWPAPRPAAATPAPTPAWPPRLLASAKDRDEHRITIDMVHDTLLPWCSYLDEEAEPSIVAMANVQHLATLVEGRLSRPPASVLELVRRAAPHPGGRRLAPSRRRSPLIAALRGPRPRPLRRPGRLGRRRRQRRVGRRHPLRRARRAPRPGCSPASASSPTPTPPPSWPRPGPSSRPCSRPSSARNPLGPAPTAWFPGRHGALPAPAPVPLPRRPIPSPAPTARGCGAEHDRGCFDRERRRGRHRRGPRRPRGRPSPTAGPSVAPEWRTPGSTTSSTSTARRPTTCLRTLAGGAPACVTITPARRARARPLRLPPLPWTAAAWCYFGVSGARCSTTTRQRAATGGPARATSSPDARTRPACRPRRSSTPPSSSASRSGRGVGEGARRGPGGRRGRRSPGPSGPARCPVTDHGSASRCPIAAGPAVALPVASHRADGRATAVEGGRGSPRRRGVELVVHGDVGGAVGAGDEHDVHAARGGRGAAARPRRPSVEAGSRRGRGRRRGPPRSTPWGVPKSCSKRSAARAAAWGRNEKMPPPSLSTTTMVRSMPRSASAEQGVGVVEEGDVADEHRGRAARAEGDADGGGHHAVDAVGAPVGVAPATPVAGRGVPLDVAHRHRRRHHERGARRAARRRTVAGDAGLGELGVARRARRSMAAGGRGVGGPPRRPADRAAVRRPARPSPTRASRPAPAHAARRDRRRAARPRSRSGSNQAPSASTPTCQAPSRRPATGRAPSTPAARRGAARPRAEGAGDAVRAGPRRSGDDRRRRGRGSPLRGSASTGQPSGAGQRECTASGSPMPPPATITPAAGVDAAGEPRRCRRGSATRPRRRSCHGAPAGRPAPAARPGSPTSGSRNARFRCTGPGRRGRGGLGAPPRPRATATCRRLAASGTPGLGEPAHRARRTGGSGRWSAARRRRCSSGGRSAVTASSGTAAVVRPRPPRGAARPPRCRWW